MNRSNQLCLLFAAVMTLGLFACNTDVYDPDKHKEIVKYASPVDSVDQNHMWQLAQSRAYTFSANAGVGAERLEVFNSNPLESTTAEMLGRFYIEDGQQLTGAVSVPALTETLYAALVDGDGKYTVTSFRATDKSVDFSSPLATKQAARFTKPSVLAYTYCFEDEFPEPGDYDYNDIVMRLGIERTGRKQVTLHVTLAAVGSFNQIAGAVRLVGYRFQDIDSVTVSGDKFNDGVSAIPHSMIDSEEPLVEGRRNEAVVNLFVDAHWALSDDHNVEYSNITRKKLNVQRSYTDQFDVIFAKSADYTIYFKNEKDLNFLTHEMIDPFILTPYSASTVEIHLEEFKAAQVFYEYTTVSFKDLPWALKIPTRSFRYPQEGEQIGFKKDGYMFGAYMSAGHSFGEWAEDHNNYLDWYLYPLERLVW